VSTEAIVIKQFHPKEGAEKVLRSAEKVLYQLATFVLVINNFLLPPVLFIEYLLS
jgi:hypothetical protein